MGPQRLTILVIRVQSPRKLSHIIIDLRRKLTNPLTLPSLLN